MLAIGDVVVVAECLCVIGLDFFGRCSHQRFQYGDCKAGTVHSVGAVYQVRPFVLDHVAEPFCKSLLEGLRKEFYRQCQKEGILRCVIGTVESVEGYGVFFCIREVDKRGDARFFRERICFEIASEAGIDGAGGTVEFVFPHACGVDYSEVCEFFNGKGWIIFYVNVQVLDVAHFEAKLKAALLFHGHYDFYGSLCVGDSNDICQLPVMHGQKQVVGTAYCRKHEPCDGHVTRGFRYRHFKGVVTVYRHSHNIAEFEFGQEGIRRKVQV